MKRKESESQPLVLLSYFADEGRSSGGKFEVAGSSVPEDFTALISELESESDRGCVIISVSLVEEVLRQMLLSWAQSRSQMEDLISPSAAIGSAGAMSKLCRALGVLTEPEFKTISTLQKIRNKFAHNIRASFSDDSIIDQSRSLTFAGDVSDHPPRDAFLANALIVLLELSDRPSELVRVRKSIGEVIILRKIGQQQP